MFDERSGVVWGDILIRDGALDEDTECFTAELESDCIPLEYDISTTICIVDADTIVYSIQQPEYYDIVYESDGHVTVSINSSRPIPAEFEVDVDTIYGIGTASISGESHALVKFHML